MKGSQEQSTIEWSVSKNTYFSDLTSFYGGFNMKAGLWCLKGDVSQPIIPDKDSFPHNRLRCSGHYFLGPKILKNCNLHAEATDIPTKNKKQMIKNLMIEVSSNLTESIEKFS